MWIYYIHILYILSVTAQITKACCHKNVLFAACMPFKRFHKLATYFFKREILHKYTHNGLRVERTGVNVYIYCNLIRFFFIFWPYTQKYFIFGLWSADGTLFLWYWISFRVERIHFATWTHSRVVERVIYTYY